MKRFGSGSLAVLLSVTAVFVFMLAACSWGSVPQHRAASPVKLLPPAHGVYEAAFPEFGPNESQVDGTRIRTFEQQSGKPIVWAYFSNNWFNGIQFPADKVTAITDEHVIPFIRMMPRSNWHGYGQDKNYSMQNIIDGKFDSPLRQWCRDAAATDTALMVEFGTEVNGNWFPWNGKYNGAGETNGYGDPHYPDGPERFRDAYRHIEDICNAEGARNITWVFHVDAEPSPMTSWNAMDLYYPGDRYVDWLGISVYGPQKPGEQWRPFTPIMDRGYKKLTAVASDKPIALLEFGAVKEDSNDNQAEWIHAALQSIGSGRYPRSNGDGSVSNMRISASQDTERTFRKDIASDFFVTTPRFSTSG
ncbi:MAG: hypothetical protein M3290_03215 [Actinomycetota bacterium]|nr:hypothetical protein [Actinomycetota bacterium]